jgi:hypothetical protein
MSKPQLTIVRQRGEAVLDIKVVVDTLVRVLVVA